MIKSLSIGDQMPDITLDKMVNYMSKSVKFSDFRGKLVILDFWATFCSPCVRELPKMDSLQKAFGDKIAIIGVTSEKDAVTIQTYLSKKCPQIPSVIEDELLRKIFHPEALGLQVWIDGDGKVIGTTDGEEVNSKTIGDYFKTGELSVKRRIDIKGFKKFSPLFVNGNGGSADDFDARSILVKHSLYGVNTSGSGPGYYPDRNGKKMFKSFVMWNGDVNNLLHHILNLGPFHNFLNRVFVENSDNNIVPIDDFKDFNIVYETVKTFTGSPTTGLSYDLSIPPPGVLDSVFYRKYMLEDLNRYFDFTVRVERKQIPSWVIVKLASEKSPIALAGDTLKGRLVFSDNIDTEYLEAIKNKSFNDIVNFLRDAYLLSPPIFDETGYLNKKVNLDLHVKYIKDHATYKAMDLEEWRNALLKNGLDIKVENREVDILILKKKADQ